MFTDPSPSPVLPSAPSDRRGRPRQSCRLKGKCQPVTALDGGNHWPIETCDVSHSGIGILLCRRFEPGTLLAIHLSGPTGESINMPLARVCQVRSEGNRWFLGCVWVDELEGEDIHLLLKEPPPPPRTPLPGRVRLRQMRRKPK